MATLIVRAAIILVAAHVLHFDATDVAVFVALAVGLTVHEYVTGR